MSCEHCCGANRLFDLKGAKKELKRYLKKGPRKPTKLLIKAIKSADLNGLSLLDVGGGIGAIPLELIPHGVANATNIEASEGYLDIAKAEVEKRDYEALNNYLLGDFLELHEQIDSHDIVTLDKVICCYPFVDELLKTSLSKARTYYALVYPQQNWPSHLVISTSNLIFKLKGNPFRTFIHSPQLVETLVKNAGFERIYANKTMLTWHINLYKRRSN